MKFFFAIEKALVRWFGISLISWIVCRQAKVPLVPTFLITTIGRKSGREIEIPIFYFRDGSSFYIIASKGGAPQHPLWFRNLEANPRAWLWLGRKKIPVTARVAEGEERARLWAKAASAYPPYDDYQVRAGARRIPVVVLDPSS